MADWTVTLENFRVNMEALGAQGEPETLGGDIDTWLFKSITGQLKHGKALASTTNIEAAALLIRAMWKVFDNSVRWILFFLFHLNRDFGRTRITKRMCLNFCGKQSVYRPSFLLLHR